MSADLLPWPKAKFFVNGTNYPLAGGKVYTYAAGTSTPLTTYSDPGGTVPNTNPVVLDANGEANIYLTDAVGYKIDVFDASNVHVSGYPVDQVYSSLTSGLLSTADGGGVSLINGAERVVNSITALKALSKNYNSRVFVTGYYTPGDGGGGHYWYDSTDTTSTDNGGTIIVALDGARWKLIVTGLISAKQFGAKGDGATNDTAALNNALAYCYTALKTLFLPAGYYGVAESSTGSGYALLNKGVSIQGEGRFYSQIIALSSMPNTADFMLVQNVPTAYIDFLQFDSFSIQPTDGGSVKRGKRAIYMTFQTATNLAKLKMTHVYLLPGNDYSLEINNNMVTNLQGVPANSVIEDCYFAEGSKLVGIGDSNVLTRTIYRASGGSRCAIYLYMTDTSGVASHTVIQANNIDCPGGALYAIRGRSIKFRDNNVELSAGSGTVNGAIVDIDGSSGTIPWVEVESNHLGVLGTASPTSAIRINAAVGASVDKNTLLSGLTVANGILLTASAQDTVVGFNEIQSNYTSPITNSSSLRPIGVSLSITPINGFANAGGYQALSSFKSKDGIVTVVGVVTAPASPNGVVLGVLAIGYRPLSLERCTVGAVVGGLVSPQAIEIAPTGEITYQGNNTATRVEISVCFPTQNYISGSV